MPRRGGHSASNEHHCAALVSARDPLETVAAEHQILPFHEIETHFHDQGNSSDDPLKEDPSSEPQPIEYAMVSDRHKAGRGQPRRYIVGGSCGNTRATRS